MIEKSRVRFARAKVFSIVLEAKAALILPTDITCFDGLVRLLFCLKEIERCFEVLEIPHSLKSTRHRACLCTVKCVNWRLLRRSLVQTPQIHTQNGEET